MAAHDTIAERVPPQAVEVEMAVLGAMMLEKEAIGKALEYLDEACFYKDAHRKIFQAIIALEEGNEPVDLLTVSEELKRRKQLEEVGGTFYLTTLLEGVVSAANIEYHAKIVLEKAFLRKLINTASQIIAESYEAAEDVQLILDRAENLIFSLSKKRLRRDFLSIYDVLHETFEKIEGLHEIGGRVIGVPSGFWELDQLTAGFQPSDLIVVAGRPSMGKTSFILNVARNAAVDGNVPVGLFSLEMASYQIAQRMLCSEAKVNQHLLRTGRLRKEDWPRLSICVGNLAEAKIFIDDSPTINHLEIRAKSRRLKAEHDVGLIIVDYLQLVQGPRDAESRQQEISIISRSLKGVAKELNVPVIAVSQLSRAVEARSERRPQLSDLRECLTGDTLIPRADTGELVTMAELATLGESIQVWAIDDTWKLRRATMSQVRPSGIKRIWKLRTSSGRTIRASDNHPFRKLDGWHRLDELQPGDCITVPWRLPTPVQTAAMPDHELILLAHLIGDGCLVERQPLHYTSKDPACLSAVEQAASQFDVTPRRVKQKTWSHVYLSANQHLTHGVCNPIAAWLSDLGIYGKHSKTKFIPWRVFQLPNHQIALFLRHLWAADGSVTWQDNPGKSGKAQIYYATGSMELASGVYHLLLRLGISARLRTVAQRGQYHVDISGKTNQLAFLDIVGTFGAKSEQVALIRERLALQQANPNSGVISKQFWRLIVDPARQAAGLSWRDLAAKLEMSYCGSALFKSGISRERMQRLAAFLPDPTISNLAASDVLWDEIVSIEPDGEEVVYDGTVPGYHNFVANDLIVHNSGAIEQDADAVLFIYRPEEYNILQDSQGNSLKGLAEVIIGKQRNGPTGSVRLTFLKEHACFENLARYREEPPEPEEF